MSTTGDMKVDTDIGEMSMAATEEKEENTDIGEMSMAATEEKEENTAATEEKEENTASGIITEEDIVEAVNAVDTVAATQNVTVMKTIIMALNHMVEDTTHTDLTTITGDVEDTILITVVMDMDMAENYTGMVIMEVIMEDTTDMVETTTVVENMVVEENTTEKIMVEVMRSHMRSLMKVMKIIHPSTQLTRIDKFMKIIITQDLINSNYSYYLNFLIVIFIQIILLLFLSSPSSLFLNYSTYLIPHRKLLPLFIKFVLNLNAFLLNVKRNLLVKFNHFIYLLIIHMNLKNKFKPVI